MPVDPESRSVNAFLGGKVHLVQPVKGHRAGLDAALLQATVPASATGQLVELGCGTGPVLFAICARAPGVRAIGVDSDSDALTCAKLALQLCQNAAISKNVDLVDCDATLRRTERERAGLTDNSADWLVMNPPYWTKGTLRSPIDERKRNAYVTNAGDLNAWLKTASGVLKPGGHLVMINRTEKLAEIFSALVGRFGAISVKPIHAFEHEPANRILVAAQKGAKGPLRLLPPLVLHEPPGDWTQEADQILHGRTGIDMQFGRSACLGVRNNEAGNDVRASPSGSDRLD